MNKLIELSHKNFPTNGKPCYVIIEFDSYTPYTGYEKEGGVAKSSTLPRIYFTQDRDKWEEDIRDREGKRLNDTFKSPNKYLAFVVSDVAKIETEIKINLGN